MKNTWKEPLQVGRGRHDMWRIEADEMQPGNRENAKCSTHGHNKLTLTR